MYGKKMSRRASYKMARRGARIHKKNLNGANFVMRGGERLC